MVECSDVHTGAIEQPAHGKRVIGSGRHGTIELDLASMLVCKRLHDDADPAHLQREYSYLERFSLVLADVPSLSCPAPVAMSIAENSLWMTYCEGFRVDHLLEDSSCEIDQDINYIACLAEFGLFRFTEEFSEPLYSLGPQNMLYDTMSRTLSLIDFTSAREFDLADPTRHQYEISLGCFMGISIYRTLRPATVRNRTYAERNDRITRALLERAMQRRNLELDVVRAVSAESFRRLGSPGSLTRRTWYRTLVKPFFRARSGRLLSDLQSGLGSCEG
jgi:hypothetical protein